MSQNSKFDVESHYFSGQGVVTIGVMDPATKRAKYYVPAGNVTDLKVNISTSVIDHKGSQDGQRAIDKRVQTETKATATMTIENWNRTNISKALRGDGVRIPGATVTDGALVLYRDGVVPVEHLSLSAVTLKQGATSLVAFVDDATAYDYKVNLDAGSFRLNDGSKVGFSGMGTAATAVTVGATTQITVTNTAAVGDEVYLQGFTGADAIGHGSGACFMFVPVPAGQSTAFVDDLVFDDSLPVVRLQSLSMPQATKALGRPGENWQAQVVDRLNVVSSFFALCSPRNVPPRSVEEVNFLQTGVKMGRGETDAAFSLHADDGQWLVSAEVKGRREQFHLAQIARASFALGAATVDSAALAAVAGVIPLGIKVVGPSKLWVVEFEPVDDPDAKLVLVAQGVFELVPPVPGVE